MLPSPMAQVPTVKVMDNISVIVYDASCNRSVDRHVRENPMRTTSSWLVVLLLAALPLAAASEEGKESPAPAETIMRRQSLTFIDLKLFDAKLSQELNSGKDRVEVEMTGKVALNDIPERIDKWVSRVGENGSVEVREAPRTRMLIFSLLPMLFSAFQATSEDRMMEPAKNYNATILYRREANGEATIERVIFDRKK